MTVHNTIQLVECFQCPPPALCTDARDLVQEVSRARICRPFRGDQESISSLASRYDNPIFRTCPLAKSIPRNRLLGSINVYKYGLWEGPQSKELTTYRGPPELVQHFRL
jgi:hypothetical protein